MIRFLAAILVIAAFTSCRTPEAIVRREQLKALPEWRVVRTAAQTALAKNESTSLGWKRAMAENDTGAVYPLKKEGAIWLIHAADDYPMNRYGVAVEMEINSSGEVLRYTQLWKQNRASGSRSGPSP